MKSIRLLLLGICLANVSQVPSPQRTIAQLETFHRDFPQEKVYLHTDKSQYVLGEQLWGKLYLLDAIYHQRLTPSQQVHIELFDPNNTLRITRLVRIEDGGGAFDLFFAPSWEPGTYLIRAYTSYMRNFREPFFYQREIEVYHAFAGWDSAPPSGSGDAPPPERKVNHAENMTVRFYPEGGGLVSGLRSQIGIRATNSDDAGMAVQGQIVADGTTVTRFATHATGLGVCALTPHPGQVYQAIIETPQGPMTFDLPEVEETGFVLHLDQRSDSVLVQVQTNIPNGLDGSYIVAHVRGQLIGLIDNLSGSQVRYLLPLHEVPDGVLHFTLFSGDGVPRCERLIFHYLADRQPLVTLATNRENYGKRERVELQIRSTSPAGDPVALLGSLAVTDMVQVPRHAHSRDIRTYLLLESDLRGVIAHPGAFFDETNPSRNRLLDALMLTHGWRRFDWKSVLRSDWPDLQWIPENAIEVSGYVTRRGSAKRPVRANVFLSTLREDFEMRKAMTDINGSFSFGGLHLDDTVTLMFQADIHNANRREAMERRRKKRGEGPVGSRQVEIHLDPVILPELNRAAAGADPAPDSTTLEAFLEASRRVQTVDSAYADLLNIELDEVVISEKTVDEQEAYLKNRGILYAEPDQRLVIDSLPVGELATNVFDLIQGKFPGVEIVGTFPNRTARIRGINSINLNTTALILLDGIPVEPSLANAIPVRNIAFVDVIASLSKTAAYGGMGRSGIIAIYRKRPGEHAPRYREVNGVLHYTHPGYYQAIRFESPDHGRQTDPSKPDLRTTVFWDPDIRTEPDRPYHITFYTADRATVYAVRLEGITASGQPVVETITLQVQ